MHTTNDEENGDDVDDVEDVDDDENVMLIRHVLRKTTSHQNYMIMY